MNRVVLVIVFVLVISLCLVYEMNLPCKHKETRTETVAATCVKTGTIKVICKDCDEVVSTKTLPKSDKHVIVAGRCGVCGAEKCSKTNGNHTFKVYRSEPGTCLKRGIEWKRCSGCGYDKVAETVFAAHTYEEGVCTLCGDIDKDYVPKTGDNSVVIIAGMVVVAMVSALGYVYVKKEKSYC